MDEEIGNGEVIEEDGGNAETEVKRHKHHHRKRRAEEVTQFGYLDVDLKEIKRRRLFGYMEAEKAILAGAQEYELENRKLTRANLSEIRKQINDLIAELALEETISKNGNVRRVMFI